MASELKSFEDSFESFDIEHFQNFVFTHQNMLFPAFQMQLAIQRKVLGPSFWERIARRRMKMSDGKYVSVGQFILQHSELTEEDHIRRQEHKRAAKALREQFDTAYLDNIAGSKASRRKMK